MKRPPPKCKRNDILVPSTTLIRSAWIYKPGLHGLFPHCGKGKMFKHWLKVEHLCPECGLDYEFATPDDGPAFFSLCFIAFPLIFLVVWFEVAFSPPWWKIGRAHV